MGFPHQRRRVIESEQFISSRSPNMTFGYLACRLSSAARYRDGFDPLGIDRPQRSLLRRDGHESRKEAERPRRKPI
jgi:hypothetical protein